MQTRLSYWMSIAALATAAACGGKTDGTREPASIACPANPPAWAAGTSYSPGQVVTYQGVTYECRQPNTALDSWTPTAVPALWLPVLCVSGGGGGDNPPTNGGGGNSCSSTDWQQGTSYVPGDVVLFKGNYYKCTNANPGYDPTVSTWFWSPTTCTTTGGGGGAGGAGGGGGTNPPPVNPGSGKLFAGYFQSWSDNWAATGAGTGLAKVASYVNVVNLSFMSPGASYQSGSGSLAGTGLSFSYTGPVLKEAVQALKTRAPNTRVLVSVGGATYPNWASFNPQAIAAFVNDFGLDGVDIDYEPGNPACGNGGGTVSCPSDAEYVSVVQRMRAALPSPKWITIAGWSVGAYGEGAWASAPPESAYKGLSLAVLKQAGSALDAVFVMSYDASDAYNPQQALAAYAHYYKGRIAMGIETPPEAWGGHIESVGEIDALASSVNASGTAGLMLWSLQKPGPTSDFAAEICKQLGLANCSSGLFGSDTPPPSSGSGGTTSGGGGTSAPGGGNGGGGTTGGGGGTTGGGGGASSGALPKHVLTGYWQNFNNGAKVLKLADVPSTYDLIAVAFADANPAAGQGAVTFNLDSGLSSALGGYTEAQFIADIKTLHAQGRKVIISVGGQNGTIAVQDSGSAANFANSVYQLIQKYGFDGVDIDLENGVSPTYMAQSLKQLGGQVGANLVITMAPQTIDMQSTGMGYFQLALAIKDILTIVNMQYYNSGAMLGSDGKVYSQGGVDFLTALAAIQLAGGLRPDQIGLGLPASPSGAGCGGFRPAQSYAGLRGAMTWSINWDASNGYSFANTVRPHLNALP